MKDEEIDFLTEDFILYPLSFILHPFLKYAH